MEFLKTNFQFVRWQEIIKNGFILQQGTRAPNESAVKSAVNSARLPAPLPVRPANTPRHTLPS